MLQALTGVFRSRYQSWLDRRIPKARSLTLDQSRIFILPSSVGLAFTGLLILLLLVAINYQNNMVFALVFLLASTFFVTILHTFANLSGLSVTVLGSQPAFVGETVRFDVKVARTRSAPNYDIILSFPESDTVNISLIEQSEMTVHLWLPARQRGLLRPPRLLLKTYYPLGLLRCWTWLALDIEALVYPKPIEASWRSEADVDGEEGEQHLVHGAGSDDFYAFRNYQSGDPLKHVSWKTYAKGQELMTKQFQPYQDQQVWLNWDEFSGGTEQRLSAICFWVLRMARTGSDYGLRLPTKVLEPDSGESHRDRALAALALFRAE